MNGILAFRCSNEETRSLAPLSPFPSLLRLPALSAQALRGSPCSPSPPRTPPLSPVLGFPPRSSSPPSRTPPDFRCGGLVLVPLRADLFAVSAGGGSPPCVPCRLTGGGRGRFFVFAHSRQCGFGWSPVSGIVPFLSLGILAPSPSLGHSCPPSAFRLYSCLRLSVGILASSLVRVGILASPSSRLRPIPLRYRSY